MFRFWTSETKGCDQVVDQIIPPSYGANPASLSHISGLSGLGRLPKRRRSSLSNEGSPCEYCLDDQLPTAKRTKAGQDVALLSPQSTIMDSDDILPSREASVAADVDGAREAIQFQFGLEILVRHDELRLINQELAKCQVALEQLRRCHLIPYPTSCPTPAQMLEISSGKGSALQPRHGDAIPKWAPPFGVVEGPYARHYAKWLIPDSKFDGLLPEPHGLFEMHRARNVSSASAEARAARNAMADATNLAGKGRPVRGSAGQKLHALSSGYAQAKDRQGPCVLKRADGQTVKLVCVDCQRWDFSSTQGFINHCRIAHRRDFKSHEEAAVHCGHPIDADIAVVPALEEKPAFATAPSSGLAHPFARDGPLSEQQAYASLRSRIDASLKLYRAGKLPHIKSIPGDPFKSARGFVGDSSTPFLSQLLANKQFRGDLSERVGDARTKADDEDSAQSEDSDDPDLPCDLDGPASPARPTSTPAVRAPAVMRVPGHAIVSPVPPPVIPTSSSSSKHRAFNLTLDAVSDIPSKVVGLGVYGTEHEEVDVHLSPNTMASNNAPSLVSDDGEYSDDSDDASSSETGDDGIDTESVSDVAEINIADGEDAESPQSHHHDNNSHHANNHGSSSRKEEDKHVTFITSIPSNTANAKGRRKEQI